MRPNVVKNILVLEAVFVFALAIVSFSFPIDEGLARKVGETHLNVQKKFLANYPFLSQKSGYSEKEYSILGIKTLKDANGKILAYVLDLSPEGYIVISPDTDIRPVIAYSFTGKCVLKDTPQNIFLHLVTRSMKNALAVLTKIPPKLKEQNHLLWDQYAKGDTFLVQQLSASMQYGPYLTTQWNQIDPYNKFCPLDPTTGERSVPGCVAVADGQIFNYWKIPHSISFSPSDRYSYTYDDGQKEVTIDDSHIVLDFPSFSDLNQKLSNIAYSGDEDEIAALLFAIGIKLHGAFGSLETVLPEGDAFKLMGYANTRNMMCSIDGVSVVYQACCDNIEIGRPVVINVGMEEVIGGAHSVVADGYKDTGEVHLNYGWGGVNDGWYFINLWNGWNPPVGGSNWFEGAVVDIYPSSGLPENGGGGGGCFIATAAFGSPLAKQIQILREFRDRYLLTNHQGQRFVAWYYQKGPIAADYSRPRPALRAVIRILLYPLIIFSFLMLKSIFLYLLAIICGIILVFRFKRRDLRTV